MKKIAVVSLKGLLLSALLCVALFCAALFTACNKAEPPASGALDKDTSYSFGMLVAAQMGFAGISFDYNAFMEGFRDFNEDRNVRLTQEEAMEKVLAALSKIESQGEEEQNRLAEVNQEEGNDYLEENAQRPGVVTTESGLQYEVIVQGSGARPGATDTVKVHYHGTYVDGTVFDSSIERGEPVEFPVGAVIQGWIEGLQLMNIGSTYRFVIPADIAYGPRGIGPIPPNKVLIFNVELIDIVR
ncbi:MAG: FKBP-type peptidyl-prolyl cis-trans isomerase [Treponema sp.]|nr:FKBP-type peptidyl-prolyl cis-trans isomerase [Treponema sp.]